MPSTLTVGSLFSGIEGFGLGFEQAGMTVSWRCEIDPKCRELLAAKWPGVPVYDDVREVHGAGACVNDLRLAGVGGHGQVMAGQEPAVDYPPSRGGSGAPDLQGLGPVPRTRTGDDRDDGTCGQCAPRVDVLCGGFPCQDLSVAGKRAGLAGERSGLFHEFMRIASEIAPRWVVIENVPGLLSSNGGRDMGVVLGTLADLGYGWCYRVLDAQYFGVAQRRRRVFIVGCLGDAASAAQVLLERESCQGDSPPRRRQGKGVAVGTLAGTGAGSGWRIGADEAAAGQLVPEVARSLNSHHNRNSEDVDTFVPEIAAALSTANGVNSNSGGRRQEDDINLVADTLRSHPRPGSNTNGAIVVTPTMTVCLGSDPISTEEVAQPVTGRNGDPGVVAYPVAIRDRTGGAVAEVGEEGTYNALRAGDGGSSRQQLVLHSEPVAYPVAMRGRDDGVEMEMGPEGVYNALRAGDGGSSRQNLVAYRPEVVATVSAWQMRNSQGSNQLGVKVGEEVTDCLDTAGAPGVAYSTKLHNTQSNQAGKFYEEYTPGLQHDSPPPVVAFSENQRGEILETDIARQITTGGGKPGQGYPAVRQAMAVRRLTPMECERLQGFPDGWTAGFVDSTRYRMLGNAVCVAVARWIGEHLLGVANA